MGNPNHAKDGKFSSGNGSNANSKANKLANGIKRVAPKVKEIDVKHNRDGSYTILASTARQNGIAQKYLGLRANPEVSFIHKTETGIEVNIDPKRKTGEFVELHSHIKGAGTKLVKEVIRQNPDVKFSVIDASKRGADGKTYWDKVKEAHPKSFGPEQRDYGARNETVHRVAVATNIAIAAAFGIAILAAKKQGRK